MSTPLQTTRLYIPPARAEMVPRPRLLERLNAGLDRKLTLMRHKHKKVRAAVRREHAENYILTSVVAFAVTVIATRGYLELTGHP